MTLPVGSAVLWAMHPHVLASFLRVEAATALLPEAFRFRGDSFAAAGSAGRQPAATQEGATLILTVAGILAPAGMYHGGTAYEWIADRVRDAAADKRVSTIIIVFRSPGGTVWGCEEAADAIMAARAAKPVIAVADPFSFSAAYWLATQASRFYVTTSGEVGSVGVRSGHVDMSGLEALIGIRTTLIASSPDKIAGHPYAALSEADRAEIQEGVDFANGRFARSIARGRGMRLADVAAVHGTGKTFSARRAYAHGAIDDVARHGSAADRLALMRRQAAAAEQIAKNL